MRRVKFTRMSRRNKGAGFGAAHTAYAARHIIATVPAPRSWADRQAEKNGCDVERVVWGVKLLSVAAVFLICWLGGPTLMAMATGHL